MVPDPVTMAAIIKTGGDLFKSIFQSRSTGKAADIQARAIRDASILDAQTARQQLDYVKGHGRWLRAATEATSASNYAQWLADQKNVELGGWDTAVNRRALTTREARQQYAGELAQGRNIYDRWQNQQQRLGTIGQLTGGGPRQIAGWQEAPYMPFDPLQRSARTYPDYVPGPTEIPPDPALAAQIAEANRLERLAESNRLTPEEKRANAMYGNRRNV
jgi:hypothetical protein